MMEISKLRRKIIRHAVRNQRVHWQGVYEQRSDVPAHGPGFDGDDWAEQNVTNLRMYLKDGRKKTLDGQLSKSLIVAAGMMNQRPLSVLDFGGGAAYALVALRNLVDDDVSYHLVERKEMLTALGPYLSVLPDVYLYDDVMKVTSNVDLVYARTAIQYHPDPYLLLDIFTRLGAEYILLEETSAGDVPDFFTAQVTLAGSSIPYAFLNRTHVLDHMQKREYELILEFLEPTRLKMDNLPSTHRIDHPVTMMFRRQVQVAEAG